MLSSQPKIPEIGSEFLTAESFKEAAQQNTKAAGFAFSMLSSKLLYGEKGGHIPYILLQCIMGGKYRNNHKFTKETRKRIKSTKCQNCSVILYAVLNENAEVWQLNAEQKKLVHIMLKSEALV
ncbi:13889_t:CDS:2 [Cetraspora pellucida]|uniref:13889_t:CDS:1 n=1 Tax=Cetraspora pellucida TaxID=1433469 RepID=A0ACA9KAQ9_9GLOM|nr:13889_t:CDS:2 [Cetraspora pellucida]